MAGVTRYELRREPAMKEKGQSVILGDVPRDVLPKRSRAHKTGPSIATALFQSRRLMGHRASISAVTSCAWARYSS